MKQASTGLVSCCNSSLGMFHVCYVLPSTSFFLYLVSLSFFNPHPSNRVSYSPLRAWDRVQLVGPIFERARTRVSARSRAGVLVDLFHFQFVNSFRSMQWRFVELAAGLDLTSFWKNVVCSSPRPQCLGTDAMFKQFIPQLGNFWCNWGQNLFYRIDPRSTKILMQTLLRLSYWNAN